MDESRNIAAILPRMAAERGAQVAMRCPGSRGLGGYARYDSVLTYAQLESRSNAIAAGLGAAGLQRGQRAALMVRPTPEFFLLMFALFKLGAVPVLIDPGIPKKALKQCLGEAEPEAFIGIPLAQFAKGLFGWAPKSRLRVTVGPRLGWGGHTLEEVEKAGAGVLAADAHSSAPPVPATEAIGGDEVAAILFTSGSTGVPKGVVYRHRHFVAQVEMLREAFGMQPGGVDLPTFPPFALFDPALGLSSIIPDMDPTRPARASPRRLHKTIREFGVTQLFGSPALIAVLAKFGQPLAGVKRITSAGAPVPADIVARMRELMDADAQLWTPYGATECLPVAVIEARELETTRELTERGAGTCVGRPVPPNRVRIIPITDAAIPDWTEGLELPRGQLGEITVRGPSATDTYFRRPEATVLAKIREQVDGAEHIVHRMGDLGWFDGEGRLWFCGRKSQRVLTEMGGLYTEQVEPVFNTHPRVRRTALVGVGERGHQVPVLCVELEKDVKKDEVGKILFELEHIGQGYAHTGRISNFLVHPRFPVDIRHNAKIGREQLAEWAARELRKKNRGQTRDSGSTHAGGEDESGV
jgi:acyl-CoA synthetase (AMP-forming)/AMP-acid ligase II